MKRMSHFLLHKIWRMLQTIAMFGVFR